MSSKTEAAVQTVEETEKTEVGIDKAAVKEIAKHFAKQIVVTAAVVVVTNVAVHLITRTRKTEKTED